MSRDPKRELSATCRVDLDTVVKNLQNLRRPISTVHPVGDRSANIPLLELFAEEAKFLRDFGVKPSSVLSLLMTNLGLPTDGPFGVAATLTSSKFEESPAAPNYHNAYHSAEVVLASYILGRREKLPVYRVAELLIAAMAHDLGHTGEPNHFDYEWETHSVQLVHPLLEQAGLPLESIQRIEQMVLATDFKVGVPWARQNYLNTRAPNTPEEARFVAAQCLLLTEADVLFSCFDLSYNELLSKLLSQEWKRGEINLTLEERIQFLSSVHFLSQAALQLGLEERRIKLLDDLNKLRSSPPPQ
jgi:hypothetical protein